MGEEKETPGADPNPGLGELVGRLVQDGRTLLRQEVELAKLEVARTLGALARGSAIVAGGILFLALGLLVLLVFAILALGRLLGGEYWLSTLLIGSIFTTVGLILVVVGRRGIREGRLRPDTAIRSARETQNWARNEVRELKRDLSN